MSKLSEANQKIEKAVVEGYKKIEDGVVSGYEKIERGVVEGYKKVEELFIDSFLIKEGESADETRERIKRELSSMEEQK